MASPEILRLQAVMHRHRDALESEPPVLNGADLTVLAGESFAVVGPSGAGKSTLLSIAGLLERPTSGRVNLCGADVTQADEEARTALRRRDIGFIFQQHLLLPQCDALENVLVPLLATGASTTAAQERRAAELLEAVGLSHRRAHRPSAMSMGERQRVAIARALIHDPKLLLADEPTGALDRRTAADVATLLAKLQRERRLAMLVVTHSEELAAGLGQTLLLDEGRLVPRKAP